MTLPHLSKRLAMQLPDEPRWVEVRSMLLGGWAEVFGLNTSGELSFAAADPGDELISVVGHPQPEAIQAAVAACEPNGELTCQFESKEAVKDALPGWKAEPAVLHRLRQRHTLVDLPPAAVELLGERDITRLTHIDDDLKRYLRLAFSRGLPVAGTIVDGRPVAFGVVGSRTETLWDVSIDTLEAYRRRGYAGAAVSFLVSLMRREGKEPVWGALESNVASKGLAARLGFETVDELLVFERPNV